MRTRCAEYYLDIILRGANILTVTTLEQAKVTEGIMSESIMITSSRISKIMESVECLMLVQSTKVVWQSRTYEALVAHRWGSVVHWIKEYKS